MCVQVWCACIRHDDWAGAAAAGAGAGAGGERDALQDRLFFKLIDLVHVMGEPPPHYLFVNNIKSGRDL